MLNVDPPDHTRLRRLVSRAFAPSRIAALEPAIRAIAGQLLDDLDDAGPGATVDLIEGYAYPLAVPGDRRAARHPHARPPAPARLVSGAANRLGR